MAERGFSRMTMEGIADDAGIGVATVYKYFGTKVAILDGIVRPTLEKAFAEAEKVIADPPLDPGTAMAALIDKYRYFRNDWSDRKLLRTLTLLGPAREVAVSALVRESEKRCRQQIRDLLLVLKGRGDLNPDLKVDDASMIVFCVFNQHYEFYLTDDDTPPEKLFTDLARRTKLLFHNWKNDSIF